MKKLIERIQQVNIRRRTKTSPNSQDQVSICNYANNYYGDRVCR